MLHLDLAQGNSRIERSVRAGEKGSAQARARTEQVQACFLMIMYAEGGVCSMELVGVGK